MKKRELIGRSYNDDEQQEADQTMDEWAAKAKEPLPGEIAKTPEDLKLIDLINQVAAKEFLKMGLPSPALIKPDQVHVLSKEAWRSFHPEAESLSGLSQAVTQSIVVKRESGAQLLITIFHEAIHLQSKAKYHIDDSSGISEVRSGYRLTTTWKRPRNLQAFRGFNEILVDATVLKFLADNIELLDQELGMTIDDISGPHYGYMSYAPILSTIVSGISTHTGEPKAKVLAKLIKGQFSNTLLALRDVERVFGAGSLEILSYLGAMPEHEEALTDLIKEYFDSDTVEKRELARTAVLEFVEDKTIPEKL